MELSFRQIKRKFDRDVKNNLEQYIARYRQEFDSYICADNAREFCQEYREGTPELRAKYTDATSYSANKITEAVYHQMLSEPAPFGRRNEVAFITGGMASGKTKHIDVLQQQHQIIYELVTSLSFGKIEEAFAHHKKVIICYLYRPIEQAARSLITRTEQEGRGASLSAFVKGHYWSQHNFLQIVDKYGNREGFSSLVIDNSRFGEAARASNLALVNDNVYKQIEILEEQAKKEIENVYRKREQKGKSIPEFIREQLFPERMGTASQPKYADYAQPRSPGNSEGDGTLKECRTSAGGRGRQQIPNVVKPEVIEELAHIVRSVLDASGTQANAQGERLLSGKSYRLCESAKGLSLSAQDRGEILQYSTSGSFSSHLTVEDIEHFRAIARKIGQELKTAQPAKKPQFEL